MKRPSPSFALRGSAFPSCGTNHAPTPAANGIGRFGGGGGRNRSNGWTLVAGDWVERWDAGAGLFVLWREYRAKRV